MLVWKPPAFSSSVRRWDRLHRATDGRASGSDRDGVLLACSIVLMFTVINVLGAAEVGRIQDRERGEQEQREAIQMTRPRKVGRVLSSWGLHGRFDPKIWLMTHPRAPRYWGAIRQLDSTLDVHAWPRKMHPFGSRDGGGCGSGDLARGDSGPGAFRGSLFTQNLDFLDPHQCRENESQEGTTDDRLFLAE